MNYLNFMFSRCKHITNMRRRLVLFETVSSKQYDNLDKLLPRDTSECFKKVIVCITISFSSPLIKDRIIRMFGKRSKPVRVIQHELNRCFPVALGGARVGYYLPYVGLVHRYGVGPREPGADPDTRHSTREEVIRSSCREPSNWRTGGAANVLCGSPLSQAGTGLLR